MGSQVELHRHQATIHRVGREAEQLQRCGSEQRIALLITDDAESIPDPTADPHDDRREFSDDRPPVRQDELGAVVGDHAEASQEWARKQAVRRPYRPRASTETYGPGSFAATSIRCWKVPIDTAS